MKVLVLNLSTLKSTSPHPCLEDVFELCRKSKEDILRWLRQELIIGDGLNVVTATRSWYLGFNFRVLG